MTSHFRWYGDEAAPTVPFNRRYFFPEEANHAKKNIIKVLPRNPATYSPTGTREIRIDFPTDGFLDPKKTLLEFDVTLSYAPGVAEDYSIIRFQNSIQSTFRRLRLEYGSSLLEEIQQYGKLARIVTTHTGTGQTGGIDQMSISDGVAGAAWGATGTYGSTSYEQVRMGMVNGRQAFVQGISLQKAVLQTASTDADLINRNQMASNGFGGIPYGTLGEGNANTTISVTRRYSVPLLCGLMQQSKLLPLKFMAQLTLVMDLEDSAGCIFWQQPVTLANGVPTVIATSTPTYTISNVSLNSEVLHFDSQYNADFMDGLKTGGVPIKFASFTHFQSPAMPSTTQTLTISEKARSVKAVFTALMRDGTDITKDNGASFSTTDTVGGALSTFQYKVGTAYYPAQPVQCDQQSAPNRSNGGSEAYSHLQKALNMMGDSRLSTTADIINWTGPCGVLYNGNDLDGSSNYLFKYATNTQLDSLLNEYDGKYAVTNDENGKVILFECESSTVKDTTATRTRTYAGRAFAGNWNSAQFVMAMSFDTSNGIEISGINALQQSDIVLTIKWSDPQREGMTFHTWTYFDTMLLLLENNVVQTIK